MPNKKSAAKALRQNVKRAARNKNVKVALKTVLKKSRRAIEAKEKDSAKKMVSEAIKSLDKAAQKKIIKKNNAARKKSQLMKKLNSL